MAKAEITEKRYLCTYGNDVGTPEFYLETFGGWGIFRLTSEASDLAERDPRSVNTGRKLIDPSVKRSECELVAPIPERAGIRTLREALNSPLLSNDDCFLGSEDTDEQVVWEVYETDEFGYGLEKSLGA